MNAMPALFVSHGAPPLVDSELWVSQLEKWSSNLPRPTAILIVSAHWESAPLTIGATTTGTPLVYDFGGFPRRSTKSPTSRRAHPNWPARSRRSCPTMNRSCSNLAAVSTTGPTSRSP